MDRAELKQLSHDELVDLAENQAKVIETLRNYIGDLQKKLSAFEARVEELERQAKRAAAPFGRPQDQRCKDPKRPGRKGGHKGHHRERLTDEDIKWRIEVPLSHCPYLRRPPLEQDSQKAVEQTILEIPQVEPAAIRLITHRNTCCRCNWKVASTHPLQVSTALGAAGTHLGPKALAIAAQLNKGRGLTMRKTCQVLEDLLGLKLTPGGLSQALDRVGKRLEPEYEALAQEVKAQKVVYTDETSWWVGGPGYSL